MYQIRFYPYHSMEPEDYGTYDKEEAREEVASIIRDRRRDGLPCTTLERGERWEVLEPEDNYALVPDDCGILALCHITFKCQECGQRWEDKERQAYCCSEQERWDMMSDDEREELEENCAS